MQPSSAEATQIQQLIENLLSQKNWDKAKLEIEKISYSEFRDEMRFKLVKSLSKAKELDRALKLVMELFPQKQSREQAKGIGIVASELVLEGQFTQALEVLKLSSHDASSAAVAVLPVVSVVLNQERSQQLFIPSATPEQLEKLRIVVSLFPGSNYQEKVWHSIGESISLEPRLATKVTELIQDEVLRSTTLDRFAEQWIDRNLTDRFSGLRTLGQNWQAANQIRDCVARSRVFLDIASFLVLLSDFLVPSYYQPGQSETAHMLDQLEALINAIDEDKLGDRRISAQLRLKLVQVNIDAKREAQSVKLLERVTNDQKKFQYAVDRADFLLVIADYYRFLRKPAATVRALEVATDAVQTAYSKPQQAVENSDLFQVKAWREQSLYSIMDQYESLNLPAKAAKIRQMLNAYP